MNYNNNIIDDDDNSIPVLNNNLQIKELETLVYEDIFNNNKINYNNNNDNLLNII